MCSVSFVLCFPLVESFSPLHIDSVRKPQSKVCSNDWLLAVTYSACQLSRKGEPVDPRELHGKFHEAGVQADAQ